MQAVAIASYMQKQQYKLVDIQQECCFRVYYNYSLYSHILYLLLYIIIDTTQTFILANYHLNYDS